MVAEDWRSDRHLAASVPPGHQAPRPATSTTSSADLRLERWSTVVSLATAKAAPKLTAHTRALWERQRVSSRRGGAAMAIKRLRGTARDRAGRRWAFAAGFATRTGGRQSMAGRAGGQDAPVVSRARARHPVRSRRTPSPADVSIRGHNAIKGGN